MNIANIYWNQHFSGACGFIRVKYGAQYYHGVSSPPPLPALEPITFGSEWGNHYIEWKKPLTSTTHLTAWYNCAAVVDEDGVCSFVETIGGDTADSGSLWAFRQRDYPPYEYYLVPDIGFLSYSEFTGPYTERLYYVYNRPSATCYFKLWLFKAVTDRSGMDPTSFCFASETTAYEDFEPYIWLPDSDPGRPCAPEPARSLDDSENLIYSPDIAIPVDPYGNDHVEALIAKKWSLLPYYEPDDPPVGNPYARPDPDVKPNGLPYPYQQGNA